MSPVRDFTVLRALSISRREALIVAFEQSCAGMSPTRRHRLVEILRRHVFDAEPPKTLYSQFRVSKRCFFLDRDETLRRLSRLPVEGVDCRTSHDSLAVHEPARLMLTQARALYASGSVLEATSMLDRIDDSILPRGDRFDAFRLTVEALNQAQVLRRHQERLELRIRRWIDESTNGTPDWYLAASAASWLRMRLSALDGYYLEPVRRGALDAISFMRLALPKSDRATVLAYCRILADSITAFSDSGDFDNAASQLHEMQRILAQRTDLAPIFALEEQLARAQMHWYHPANVRLSRIERRTAYQAAVETPSPRAAWECLFFEVRDQLVQGHIAGALALARQFSRSVDASENLAWRILAEMTLVRVYRAAGRHADAEQAMTELLSHDLPGEQLANVTIGRCELAYIRRDFRELLEQSTKLVEIFAASPLASQKASALALHARAEYRVGAFKKAVTAIEAAVAIYESSGQVDPLNLQTIYTDALRITGRKRYQDALGDITSTLIGSDGASFATHMSGLSERQLQTARLAATGLTNGDIGETLNISARTVEKHLDAVFAHFGIRSRRQLLDVIG